MIFKRLLLLIAIIQLGACVSLTNLMPNSEQANTSETAPIEKEDASSTDTSQTSTETQALSPQQELAIMLHAQSDLFQQSKTTLNPNVLNKVVNILANYQAGNYESSQTAMNTLLQTELNISSPVYVLAGDIELALNKQQQAMKYYRQALQLNQYNAKAANRIAKMLREQGQFTQALAMYNQAINAQPSHSQSYRNRAVLFDLYLNEKAKAYEDYQAYSALLNYQLEAQSNPSLTNNAPKLPEQARKQLEKNITLVNRWLADVGRQVEALAKAQASAQTSGQ